MTNVAGRSDEPISRLACQDTVRVLSAKYAWRLLPDDALVERVLQAAQKEAASASLEQRVTSQYKLALYEACQQTADLELRKRAYSDLYAYLYRAAYNRWPDMAEEIAQRALLLTYEKLDECRVPAAILTFAMWQARRAFSDIRRAGAREVPIDEIAETSPELALPMPSGPLFDPECLRLLLDALRRLSERQRQVIALKYLEGLSDSVISERTGLSISNARVLRNRGLKRLRNDQRLREMCLEAPADI